MHCRAGDEPKGPFPSEDDDTQNEVDDLENGERLHGHVEVGGQEVEEDLGPEEAFECCCYLICVAVSSCIEIFLPRNTYKQKK